uniref:Putative secreted protein n=1 Tax=Anopheles darlingi TaxID=43151 RepID=A0A2M4D1F6_ANODA
MRWVQERCFIIMLNLMLVPSSGNHHHHQARTRYVSVYLPRFNLPNSPAAPAAAVSCALVDTSVTFCSNSPRFSSASRFASCSFLSTSPLTCFIPSSTFSSATFICSSIAFSTTTALCWIAFSAACFA